MSTLKFVLKDNTEIPISSFTLPLHLVVLRDTKDEISLIWDSMTEDNLTSVSVTEDGNAIMQFANCAVEGNQIVVNPDNTYTGHYYLKGERQYTNNSDYEKAAKILLGEEV